MRHYVVVTPEYQTHPGSDLEPPEYGRDVALVSNVKDSTESKWVAVEFWEDTQRYSWPAEQRRDGKHPLTGVSARRVYEDDLEFVEWGRADRIEH